MRHLPADRRAGIAAVNCRRLLAKSSRTPDAPQPPETLAGHLAAVTRIGVLLVEAWGERYLASLGLNPARFWPGLRLSLPRAALAHDLGKANDHFQRMLRADRGIVAQPVPHEQLSVWLTLQSEPLGAWLLQGCDQPLGHAIWAAVLGHHL